MEPEITERVKKHIYKENRHKTQESFLWLKTLKFRIY